jgi:hypothetical protein
MASRALTWKYGSSTRRRMYSERPSCCQSSFRQLFPALGRSHRIGSANCFSGERASTTRLRLGISPAAAASSCRDLLSRQRLYSVWKMWFEISCARAVSAADDVCRDGAHRDVPARALLVEQLGQDLDRVRVLQDLE